ncbi:DUF7537 family lipoprotein [Halorubrum sp. DTA98]|uniref:DUF7537 family lipoprotein n=1 Tax=Halorubrum sp. DTA98 TaxID=3402163 RepID=UPI003AAD2D68
MQRRRFLTGIAGGVTVGTAGCSAPLGGGDTAITDVEWLDGDGLDADLLAERHSDALVEAGSFELFSTAETTHDGDEEPSRWLPSQEYEARFETERDRQYLRQELTDAEEPDVFELYVADDEAFGRETAGDEVVSNRRSIDRSSEAFREAMREESRAGVAGVGGWNMTVEDRMAEFDGERTVMLVADEFTGDAGVPEAVATAEATMHVTADGVVPSLDQWWEGTQRGQGASVEVDIAFRDVGETTVDEPDWVADVRESDDGGT